MHDPVCGMQVDVELAEHDLLYEDHAGKRYFFCANACRQVFLMEPERFVAQRSAALTRDRREKDA